MLFAGHEPGDPPASRREKIRPGPRGPAAPIAARANNVVSSSPSAPPRQHTSRPIVTGTSVLGIKARPPRVPRKSANRRGPRARAARAPPQYKDGVMLAADTLASYGSLAMFKDVQRISKTGSYTLVGASGEMSDYHAILRKLEGLERDNLNANDGFEHSPVEIYSYLRAVMYQARNKFNPLWNSLVVGGYKDGKAFLGSWHADIDEGEARALLEDCLRVLFYRDCRALDMVVLSKATADGTLVSDPDKIETDWSSASFVVPKAGEDGDGGW
ncbi:threonine-type endopeptidase [Aureococcus anophagefferens]|nr:threonine-type endopeptidase [Aureococcus anophagefferens]